MRLYEYRTTEGRTSEIKFPGHVGEFEFSVMCAQEGKELQPGSVKLIWEAMRYEGRQITYKRCDKTTFGAKPVTIGIVK